MATILFIGRRAMRQQPLVALLQQAGHDTLEAPAGDKALEIIRRTNPDLALMDILTPDTDICEFIGRVKAGLGRSRPRIALYAPAFLDAEVRALARAGGISHVVSLSAGPAVFLASVEAALMQPPSRTRKTRPPDSFAACLRAIPQKLYQRLEELEVLGAHSDNRATELAVRLETARAALEQEVKKRIWAERELTEANRRLHDQAMRDPLTGLYNRRYLEESLDREIKRAKRSGLPIGLMMIDIDHFKRCNDRFGHSAGDAALRAVGQYVQSLARGEDILCRYGGDEFVLVMTHASSRAVLERAEALRNGVRQLKIEHEGLDIGPVTLSVGIAMLPDHGESGQAALEAADAALYHAKQAGRDRVAMVNGLAHGHHDRGPGNTKPGAEGVV